MMITNIWHELKQYGFNDDDLNIISTHYASPAEVQARWGAA